MGISVIPEINAPETEVVLEPQPDAAQASDLKELSLYSPKIPRESASPILDVFFASVCYEGYWRFRFVVVTQRALRIFRTPRDYVVRVEIAISSQCDVRLVTDQAVRLAARPDEQGVAHMVYLSAQTSAGPKEFCLEMPDFLKAVTLVVMIRKLQGKEIPAAPQCAKDCIKWLLFLFSPQLGAQIDEEVTMLWEQHRGELAMWILREFGVEESHLWSIREDESGSSFAKVVTDHEVLSLESYLQPPQDDKILISTSIDSIVKDMRTTLSENQFDRLAQVALISYPSPYPLFITLAAQRNIDWGVIVEQDPVAFCECVKRSTTLIRNSYSSRSFVLSCVCSTDLHGIL